MTGKDIARFLRFVKVQPEPHPTLGTPCCIWTGARNAHKRQNSGGYGVFYLGGRLERAHRVAFRILNGRMPENGLHKCDTPACVNPLHIEDGTRSQNLRDAYQRGRRSKTMAPPSASITASTA